MVFVISSCLTILYTLYLLLLPSFKPKTPLFFLSYLNEIFVLHPHSSVIVIYTSILPPPFFLSLSFFNLSRLKSRAGGMQV